MHHFSDMVLFIFIHIVKADCGLALGLDCKGEGVVGAKALEVVCAELVSDKLWIRDKLACKAFRAASGCECEVLTGHVPSPRFVFDCLW